MSIALAGLVYAILGALAEALISALLSTLITEIRNKNKKKLQIRTWVLKLTY